MVRPFPSQMELQILDALCFVAILRSQALVESWELNAPAMQMTFNSMRKRGGKKQFLDHNDSCFKTPAINPFLRILIF